MIAKKEVRAPFDGQLGIRQVNVGQTIDARQQVVALTSLDPVYVDFALPQQHLAQLSQGLEVDVRSDAVAGRIFKGKLTAINSMVDTVTRNVSVQATLENQDHALRPGMFAKVDVMLPEKQKALVIPGSAISYAPYGDSVFVIEKKKDENGQGIAGDSAAICPRRRSPRRFCIDQGRIESRRDGRRHRRFQIAQRHGGDDQQRSRAENRSRPLKEIRSTNVEIRNNFQMSNDRSCGRFSNFELVSNYVAST